MNSRTGKAKVIILIVALILIGLGGAYVYRNRATFFPKARAPFPTIGLTLLQSANRSYRGDSVCDSRINEPALNPDDCVATLTLDAGLTGASPTFTGTVTVKNARPELANLEPRQVRCFKDVYAEDCALERTGTDGNTTTYRFTGRNVLYNQFGFVPIGIEIKLDESFHVAAIDWLNAYDTINGFAYRKWGGSYRAVLVPLTIAERTVPAARLDAAERNIRAAVEQLNAEAQRFDQTPSFGLTFERRAPCVIDPERYASTIGGLESFCGIESARAEWYTTTFTFLVSPEETCPRFWVAEKPGDAPNIPATYGSGGVVCVSVHPSYADAAAVSNLFHEFIHAFGAADHYDWLYGKDPNYTCNVAQGTSICPIAVEEIGWR